MDPVLPKTEQDLTAHERQKSKQLSPKRLRILGCALLFILLSFLFALFLIDNQKKATETSTQETTQNNNANTIPKITFGKLIQTNVLPIVPQTTTKYQLKGNFSNSEITTFAEKFGLSQRKRTETEYVLTFDSENPNTRGIMSFHKPSGAFSYESYGELKPQQIQTTPKKTALTFLQEVGIADSTVTCDITYQKTDQPGITYVECHRDWTKLGLPLYNIVGLLNVPETKSLSTLTLGSVSNSPPDATIINASTGQLANGKKRPDDFNTATVAVTSDNTILTVKSNLKMITSKESITKANILPPDEALQQIRSNKAEMLLTLPGGSGPVDWKKVYKNNDVIAESAIITDYILSYLEKPATATQSVLVPMYTARGTAKLTTGYTVRFVATVPALRDKTSFLTAIKPLSNDSKSIFPQTYAQTDDTDNGLQLRTLTITPKSTTNPDITTSPEIPTPTTIPGGPGYVCRDVPSELEVVLDIPGIGKIKAVTSGGPHSYYVQSTDFPAADVNAVRDAFFKGVEAQYVKNVAAFMQRSGQTTVVNPKALFQQINKGITCPSSRTTGGTTGQLTAPIFNCSDPKYRKDKVEEVANNVASQILQGNISQLATQPDVFPRTTAHLHWLFIDSASDRLEGSQACYISGESPTLFFYPTKKTDVTVYLPSFTTYTYPTAPNNIWKFAAEPNGTLEVASNTLSSLYYEYDRTQAMLPDYTTGYVVQGNNWKAVVHSITQKAQLLEKEEKQLLIEVANTLHTQPESPYLQISVLSRREANILLPLIILPQPDTVFRLHIVVSPVTKYFTLPIPVIDPIKRHGFTIVEVGARYN